MKLSAISNYVPNVRIATPREAANNLKKIALPAIVFVGASMMQGAKAVTYVECIDNCNDHRDAHPLTKLVCYALCAIFAED